MGRLEESEGREERRRDRSSGHASAVGQSPEEMAMT